MRETLVTVALLAGCYDPEVASCVVRCAAGASEGDQCPTGLVCVAGMCAASASGCAVGSGTDATTASCGDGKLDPGELCYVTSPVTTGVTPVYDAQFLQRGAGTIDLAYLTGTDLVTRTLENGDFAAITSSPYGLATHLPTRLYYGTFSGHNLALTIGPGKMSGMREMGGAFTLVTSDLAFPADAPVALLRGRLQSAPIVAAVHRTGAVLFDIDSDFDVIRSASRDASYVGAAIGDLSPADGMDDLVVATATDDGRHEIVATSPMPGLVTILFSNP